MYPSRLVGASLCALVLLACSLPASADTVSLANGDRVTGTLVSVDGSKVVIDSAWGGRISVDREAVQAIETDEALGVEVAGEGRVTSRLVATAAGEQGVSVAGGSAREIGIGQLALAYREQPPERLADDFRLNASYGLNITSGNADTSTHSVRSKLLFRRQELRHTSVLEVDRKIDEGNVTKDQRRLNYQLDWFFEEDWYAFGTTEYFADDIKEVDYRFTLGGGVGHQFWDNSLGALSAEAGASVVIEEIGGEGEENPALRAALDYNRFFYGQAVELFHSNEVLVLTDFDRGQILNTSTGVRFSLTDSWNVDARVDLVYETEPAPGNVKADWTYILGIGYQM